MHYVIIGNSAAAIGAVEGIRQNDSKSPITIVSNEPYHTYSRPLISYFLEGKADEINMRYRPMDFYQKNACTCIFNKTVTKINDNNYTLTLDGGEILGYDKLLVATGSSPVIPSINGLGEIEKKFTFYSYDDAKRLEAALDESSRVLIVGAGLIGLKCAEGILKRCKCVTVCDKSDKVLSSILDAESADIIGRHLEASGVKLILGAGLESFDKNKAIFDDGSKCEFDVLVMAVGVRPNIALLKDNGAKISRGIITDAHMKTSLPDIYAAGDCTESIDITCGESRVLALLPNAYRQGECAGISMTGGDFCYGNAIAMNSMGLFGLHLMTAGTYKGECFTQHEGNILKKLFYKDNRLNGFILIGDISKAGIYTGLIRNKTPLDSIDFGLICRRPTLMAFSRKFRDEALGGVHYAY